MQEAGHGDSDARPEPALRYERQNSALRAAVIAGEWATVLRLRDEGRIHDTVRR
jgi:hypothetical protein